MRWCNSFGRSLLFALLVALAYPLYRMAIGSVVGVPLAFASYAALAAALYLFGIARHPARGLAAAVVTLSCCFGLVILGATAREIALAAAAWGKSARPLGSAPSRLDRSPDTATSTTRIRMPS